MRPKVILYSEGCCLRNRLIEIRSPVLQAISRLILEIGPTAAAGGSEEKNEVKFRNWHSRLSCSRVAAGNVEKRGLVLRIWHSNAFPAAPQRSPTPPTENALILALARAAVKLQGGTGYWTAVSTPTTSCIRSPARPAGDAVSCSACACARLACPYGPHTRRRLTRVTGS